MGSLAVAFWFLGRPYQGMYHDARLYGLQAMARLYPESLGQDVFLRFGSQDAFTLFSPVYALFVAALGLEDAARLLTFFGHLWWLAAAFSIARTLLGPEKCWLAIAILAGLPGYYGAWEVFQYAEPFLTPRLYAEAAILSAIAFSLHKQAIPAIALCLLAMTLHPLMATGGVLVTAWMLLPGKWSWAVPAAVIAGLAIACAVALVVPVYPIAVFEQDWLALIRQRSPFLMAQDWGPESWEGIATALTGLWILGSSWAEASSRRLFNASVVVGLLGVTITLVGASAIQVILLTQGQGWRWIWVSLALIAVAAVRGAPAAWQAGPLQRAALLFLLSGWLLVGWPAVALLATAALTWSLKQSAIPRPIARFVALFSYAVAAASVYAWAINLPGLSAIDPAASFGRPLIYWAGKIIADGVIPSVIAIVIWTSMRTTVRYRLIALSALTTGVAALALFATLPDTLRKDYEPSDPETLRTWQDLVPADAEVLWPEDPAAAWFLLRARHYVSHDQTAGVLFSMAGTKEMLSRAQRTASIISPALAFRAAAAGKTWPVTRPSALDTCLLADIQFIATRKALDLPRAAAPLRVANRALRNTDPVYLYSCEQITRSVATQPSNL